MKGGWDSPSEVVIGTGLEIGVLIVFKGPVRSSLWVSEGVDRNRDWSTFVLELQMTGLDCRRLKTTVFCSLWTSLGLNWS